MGGERTLEERMKEYKEELSKKESMQYFLELYISDVERPKLFSVKSTPNFEDELNKGIIPEELRGEFASKLREMFGFKKDDKISFSIRKGEGKNTWIIVWKKENGDVKGFKGELVLKKRDENLDVYEEDSDFVKWIREKIIDVQIPDPEEKDKWNKFIEKTNEIRKILAISHTILDLLLFFSDVSDTDKHKRRVRNYANLLNLRRKIDDEYIKKLKNFIEGKYYIGDISEKCGEDLRNETIPNELENLLRDRNISLSEENITITEITEGEDGWKITDDSIEIFVTRAQGKLRVYKKSKEHKEPKVIIVVPVYPNLSLQSFSILNEMTWLRKLIITEQKSLRECINIYILFLNEPFLKDLEEDLKIKKQKEHLKSYRSEKGKIKLMLDANKLRIKSFINMYLINFFINEIKNKEEIGKIAQWIDKYVKICDEGIEIKVNKEEIKISTGEKGKIVDDVIEIKEDNKIEKERRESINNNEKCYLSMNISRALGLSQGNNNMSKSYKTILYFLTHREENVIIINQSFKAFILFNIYFNLKNLLSGKYLFGWDSYLPYIILPSFRYISTLSRSYNYTLMEAYKGIYRSYESQYTICYLAHLLEHLFGDIIKTFRITVSGPRCSKCERDTIIVKDKCEKCNTNHWIFRCTSCGEHILDIGNYLWLAQEIYYRIERIFLNIPYMFIFIKREFKSSTNDKINGDEDNIKEEIINEIISRLKEEWFGNVGKLEEKMNCMKKLLNNKNN